jgi:hypothetical protein
VVAVSLRLKQLALRAVAAVALAGTETSTGSDADAPEPGSDAAARAMPGGTGIGGIMGELAEAFRGMDTDDSGRVPYNDVVAVLRSGRYDLSETELTMLMNQFDLDHDGMVDYFECNWGEVGPVVLKPASGELVWSLCDGSWVPRPERECGRSSGSMHTNGWHPR